MKNKVMVLFLTLALSGCVQQEVDMKKKSGSSSKNIANQISTFSKESGVDPINAYYSIMLESDFKPFTFSMYTKENTRSLRARFKKGSIPRIKNSSIHKHLRVFHFSSEENAYNFIDTLKYDTLFSVGLMGVPSTEFGFWERGDFFESEKNIRKGIERIKECGEEHEKSKDKIECLNKFADKNYRKYNYWRAYKKVKAH